MALVLTLAADKDDYILISHGGESIRIQVREGGRRNRAIVAFLADNASADSPPPSWGFVRQAVREREG